MIAGAQMRAARALLGLDQRDLARLSGLSLPTIQRMETSVGSVRAVVDSLEKVLGALTAAGVEMIQDGAPSAGAGRGVRLIDRREMRRVLPAVQMEAAISASKPPSALGR
jgi:transcriptional regulator with XRE-family HTH domain